MPAVSKLPLAASIMVQATINDASNRSLFTQVRLSPLESKPSTVYARISDASTGQVLSEKTMPVRIDSNERATEASVRDALVGSEFVKSAVPYEATVVPNTLARVAFTDAGGAWKMTPLIEASALSHPANAKFFEQYVRYLATSVPPVSP